MLLKVKALNDAARDQLPAVIAVAFDDDGKPVFNGRVEYADGGMLGICRADNGEVTEWPAELVRLELADAA